jgi:Short C-terminal domain
LPRSARTVGSEPMADFSAPPFTSGRVEEAKNPGARDREKARKRDRDKTHAYCTTCHRRVYAGEYACEAGHRLTPDWAAKLKAKTGVLPERRPGGPNPMLIALEAPGKPSPPGPRDPWLNDVTVGLADFGFVERKRNTGKHLGGAPVEGDIVLDGDGLTVVITVFATGTLAHQAEVGVRANPNSRAAITQGVSVLRTVEQLLYLANGRGSVVDESRLDDVIQVVSKVGTPLPLDTPANDPAPQPQANSTIGPATSAGPDIIEQIRKLGELRSQGLLTDAEFEGKKAELLARI